MLNNVLDAVDATMNVTDMDDMANEAVPTASDLVDPLDEPLEEQLVLDDIYYEAARQYVTVDGMDYSFEKPRYMLYDDQARAKRKLKEAFLRKNSSLPTASPAVGKLPCSNSFQRDTRTLCISTPTFLTSAQPECSSGWDSASVFRSNSAPRRYSRWKSICVTAME